MSVADTFSKIYENNIWDYGSGPGSLPTATVEYREMLQTFINKHNIKSVLDYGCGDWQFSKLLGWDKLVTDYVGVDVVPSLIEQHQSNYKLDNVDFQLITDEWTWPTVDLIVCKDVLQHLPNAHISNILENMKRHAKFIIITNDITNVKGIKVPNEDCAIGKWRPLDLSNDPWNIKGTPILTWSIKNKVKQSLLITNF
jgi:2-polyprenyl-3-methyl-5-hydroxy-6-metoxy-1,4-benzoquinol methylase